MDVRQFRQSEISTEGFSRLAICHDLHSAIVLVSYQQGGTAVIDWFAIKGIDDANNMSCSTTSRQLASETS